LRSLTDLFDLHELPNQKKRLHQSTENIIEIVNNIISELQIKKAQYRGAK